MLNKEIILSDQVLWFNQLGMNDVDRVGGKNASLGEMISGLYSKGVQVPDGFATTADAYRQFIAHQGLDQRIQAALDALDVEDVNALAETGKAIRQWVLDTPFPDALDKAMEEASLSTLRRACALSVASANCLELRRLPHPGTAEVSCCGYCLALVRGRRWILNVNTYILSAVTIERGTVQVCRVHRPLWRHWYGSICSCRLACRVRSVRPCGIGPAQLRAVPWPSSLDTSPTARRPTDRPLAHCCPCAPVHACGRHAAKNSRALARQRHADPLALPARQPRLRRSRWRSHRWPTR